MSRKTKYQSLKNRKTKNGIQTTAVPNLSKYNSKIQIPYAIENP